MTDVDLTSAVDQGRAVVRRSPVAGTVRWLLRTHLQVAALVGAVAGVVEVVILVLVDRFGVVNASAVQFAQQGLIWFPFTLSVILATAYVNVHVAMGLTRRALGRATVLTVLIMSLVYATVLIAAFGVEGVVYHALGWPHAVTQGLPALAGTTGTAAAPMLFVEFLLLAAAGQLCGQLCGIVYYRAGGRWGTLALPLTVGPVVALNLLLSTEVTGSGTGGVAAFMQDVSVTERIVVAVAVLVLVGVAYLRLVRGTVVRPQTS